MAKFTRKQAADIYSSQYRAGSTPEDAFDELVRQVAGAGDPKWLAALDARVPGGAGSNVGSKDPAIIEAKRKAFSEIGRTVGAQLEPAADLGPVAYMNKLGEHVEGTSLPVAATALLSGGLGAVGAGLAEAGTLGKGLQAAARVSPELTSRVAQTAAVAPAETIVGMAQGKPIGEAVGTAAERTAQAGMTLGLPMAARETLVKAMNRLSPEAKARASMMLGGGFGAATGYAMSPGGTGIEAALPTVLGAVGEGIAGRQAATGGRSPVASTPNEEARFRQATGETLTEEMRGFPKNPDVPGQTSAAQREYLNAMGQLSRDPWTGPEIANPILDRLNKMIGGVYALSREAPLPGHAKPPVFNKLDQIPSEVMETMKQDSINEAMAAYRRLRGVTPAAPTEDELNTVAVEAARILEQKASAGVQEVRGMMTPDTPSDALRAKREEAKGSIKREFTMAGQQFDAAEALSEASGLSKQTANLSPESVSEALVRLPKIRERFDSEIASPNNPIAREIAALEQMLTVDPNTGQMAAGFGNLQRIRKAVAQQRNSYAEFSPKEKAANELLMVVDRLLEDSAGKLPGGEAVLALTKQGRAGWRKAYEAVEGGRQFLRGGTMTKGSALVKDEPLGQMNTVQEAVDFLKKRGYVTELNPEERRAIQANLVIESKTKGKATAADLVSLADDLEQIDPAKARMVRDIAEKTAVTSISPDALLEGIAPDFRKLDDMRRGEATRQSAALLKAMEKAPEPVRQTVQKSLLRKVFGRNQKKIKLPNGEDGDYTDLDSAIEDVRANPNLPKEFAQSLETLRAGAADDLTTMQLEPVIAASLDKAGNLSEWLSTTLHNQDLRTMPRLERVLSRLKDPEHKQAVRAAALTNLLVDAEGNVDWRGISNKIKNLSRPAQKAVFGEAAEDKIRELADQFERYGPVFQTIEQAHPESATVATRRAESLRSSVGSALPMTPNLGPARMLAGIPIVHAISTYSAKAMVRNPGATTVPRLLMDVYGLTQRQVQTFMKEADAQKKRAERDERLRSFGMEARPEPMK